MESGNISDNQIQSSSQLSEHLREKGRLNLQANSGAWCATKEDKERRFAVDLVTIHVISAVRILTNEFNPLQINKWISQPVNKSINQSIVNFFLRLKHPPTCYFPEKKKSQIGHSRNVFFIRISPVNTLWTLNSHGHRRIDARNVIISHKWTHIISMKKKNIRSLKKNN